MFLNTLIVPCLFLNSNSRKIRSKGEFSPQKSARGKSTTLHMAFGKSIEGNKIYFDPDVPNKYYEYNGKTQC